jgi:hypothetical protein
MVHCTCTFAGLSEVNGRVPRAVVNPAAAEVGAVGWDWRRRRCRCGWGGHRLAEVEAGRVVEEIVPINGNGCTLVTAVVRGEGLVDGIQAWKVAGTSQ